MEPTQAAPAGFILGGGGGGGMGLAVLVRELGTLICRAETARMPGPGCPVGLLPCLGQVGGKPGEERKQPWEPRWLLAWAL